MLMKYDLHCHSNHSDGTDSPVEIVNKAATNNIGVLSITDHDCISALDEARQEAQQHNITFVNGVELSSYSTTEIHVLGYAFDQNNDEFINCLNDFALKRLERIKSILNRLNQFKLKIDIEELPKSTSLGRLHVAKVMAEKGYAMSISDAFDRYLGSKGIAYFPSKRLPPYEAVKIIANAKGIPVLAHPLRYLQQHTLEDLIVGLKPYGLVGLECYYPSHDKESTITLEMLAKKYNLIATGGTDYHGKNRNTKLGEIDWYISQATKAALKL